MSCSINMVAVDLGASSERVILGRFDGNQLVLGEVSRHANVPVYAGDMLYWDILGLFRGIKDGLLRAVASAGGNIASIGIDAWGNDFGLLDRKGRLIGNPVHYRDDRTKGMMENAFEIVPKESIFRQTGIQFMRLNGLYQLFSMASAGDPALEAADKLLLIPDLVKFFLTGVQTSEYTVATTTQMVCATGAGWAMDMLGKLGIPPHIFTQIVKPGTFAGGIADRDCLEAGMKRTQVVSVAEHDTASAVAAVPAQGDDIAYISSGTWSLVGVETQEPAINDMTYLHNFTNEGGAFGTNRLLKNVMGLWVLQECRRFWEASGEDYGYDKLEMAAMQAHPFKCLIDPDDSRFVEPGAMPQKIASFCRETGQAVPVTNGEYVRCIRESLALKYRFVLQKLEKITGKHYPVVHIVGGGSQDGMLCQFTANSTGRNVIAGPVEATAIGNILLQAAAFGEVNGLRDIRRVVWNSFPLKIYEPEDRGLWDNAHARFRQYLSEV